MNKVRVHSLNFDAVEVNVHTPLQRPLNAFLGSVRGLLPIVSGSLEAEDTPIAGDVLGALPTVSGQLNCSVAGQVLGALPTVNGVINEVAAGEISGDVLGALPTVSGQLNCSVAGQVLGVVPTVNGALQASIGGQVLGALPTVSGSLIQPVSGIAGEVLGALPTVSGALQASIGGQVLGALPTVSGSLIQPVSGITGEVYGILPTVSGAFEPRDAATLALLPRLTASYTNAEIDKIDIFFKTLRSLGIINKYEYLHLQKWANNGADAGLNIFDTVNNNAATGSVNYIDDAGIQTGPSSYLSATFNPAAGTKFTQNSNTFGVWMPVGFRSTPSTVFDKGWLNTATGVACFINVNYTGGVVRIRANTSGSTLTTPTNPAAKMFAANRPSASSTQIIIDGAVANSDSSASVALANRPFYVGAFNNNGAANNFSSETYGADWAASAFTSTEYAGFYNALNVLYS